MLIVLRKLLELVLVVGEARINAQIPVGRQTERQTKPTDRWQRDPYGSRI